MGFYWILDPRVEGGEELMAMHKNKTGLHYVRTEQVNHTQNWLYIFGVNGKILEVLPWSDYFSIPNSKDWK